MYFIILVFCIVILLFIIVFVCLFFLFFFFFFSFSLVHFQFMMSFKDFLIKILYLVSCILFLAKLSSSSITKDDNLL